MPRFKLKSGEKRHIYRDDSDGSKVYDFYPETVVDVDQGGTQALKFLRNWCKWGVIQELPDPPPAPAKKAAPKVEPKPEPEPERARTDEGHFVPDNPATPNVNEAWSGGKAPVAKPEVKPVSKRSTRRRKKP